ncbi:MAG: ice-binding family protein [Candidatus Dormibacteraeota bacterium]|nr:ice-binding family protein [Candidatus Dormibacteraeota bacterium]
MLRKRLNLVASVGLTALLCSSSPALAQSLGAASSFADEGAAGVTAAGGAGTVITGDVGSSPSASITGFPPALVAPPFGLHANDAAAIAAQGADVALFTALGAGACTDNPGAQMSGVSFGPGIHCFASTADLAASSNMTLTGAGLYIFRVPSALTANVLSTVTLDGVDACKVFWQVGSAATLNGVNFPGNVVAQAGVTLGVGARLTGRALATVGPVTLSGTNIAGGCGVTPPVPTPPVPTLSQWAMIALTLLLALAGFTAMRRRNT